MGVRCIVVKCCLKTKRPINPAYPAQLNTLGDHLRKTRLDRGLSQPDVARILKVTSNTITTWELNQKEPTAKCAKSIIAFLGYFPFTRNNTTLGKQLYYARLITGKTQKQVAKLIDCDTSNLRCIELDERIPQTKLHEKIQEFINAAFTDYSMKRNNSE